MKNNVCQTPNSNLKNNTGSQDVSRLTALKKRESSNRMNIFTMVDPWRGITNVMSEGRCCALREPGRMGREGRGRLRWWWCNIPALLGQAGPSAAWCLQGHLSQPIENNEQKKILVGVFSLFFFFISFLLSDFNSQALSLWKIPSLHKEGSPGLMFLNFPFTYH